MEYSHPVNPLILDILIQTKIITQDNSITSISLYFILYCHIQQTNPKTK